MKLMKNPSSGLGMWLKLVAGCTAGMIAAALALCAGTVFQWAGGRPFPPGFFADTLQSMVVTSCFFGPVCGTVAHFIVRHIDKA